MRSRGEPVKNGQLTNYVTWTAVMDHVLCSEELNIVVTKANVQNRLRTLSRHYSINANILQHPSFSWEHDKNRLKVANESAWIEYCESHPDARPYRKMVIENWEDICTIFAQDEAIGDNAQTPTEVDVDMIHKDSNDAEESKETAGSNDAVSDYNYVSEYGYCSKKVISFSIEILTVLVLQPSGKVILCTKSPSRVKGGRRRQTSKYLAWATDMARVLINQLNLGNKLNGKFTWRAPAWEAAVRALEEEVDAVVTKTNVQSRLKTWYKYYSVIGDILRWPGISWDYQRHRLKVSSESSWNDY
ncbi:Myb/SANT-like domain [Dillenia turbinata]|uniref:Myb/SANT-like domain n=1 Tax=Dillenia turbinata TaxID=194707 RepID=A0AAN8Z3F9_9MAGN